MLLGYDKNGDIKFIFTDDDYLKSKFSDNSAKISDFWKVKEHGLNELFIDNFEDIDNIKQYKVVDKKLKKQEIYIEEKKKLCSVDNVAVQKKQSFEEKKIEMPIKINEVENKFLISSKLNFEK
jgi:hypothetical protein